MNLLALILFALILALSVTVAIATLLNPARVLMFFEDVIDWTVTRIERRR